MWDNQPVHGHICMAKLYEYEHDGRKWLFEFHSFIGPWPVREDGEPYKRAGAKFYSMVDAWQKSADPEQYRVGGGCITF
jgi:hypothetical protein